MFSPFVMQTSPQQWRGAFGRRTEAPFVFLETMMERLTLRDALASDRLDAFVRQEEARGVELVAGSDLERALALLITIRWSQNHNSQTFGCDH